MLNDEINLRAIPPGNGGNALGLNTGPQCNMTGGTSAAVRYLFSAGVAGERLGLATAVTVGSRVEPDGRLQRRMWWTNGGRRVP
jgi:hypothetical protein